MKSIMKITLLLTFMGLSGTINAQMKERVKERAKESATNKAERTVDQTIEETADGMINGVKSLFRKRPKKDKSASADDSTNGGATEDDHEDEIGVDNEGVQEQEASQETNGSSLNRYAKFSFIQGEEIIVFDDFKQDRVGDLPASWITTGSAEIVQFDDVEGNWVWFNKTKGNFIPEYLKDFPENFTLEFDLMYDFAFGTFSFSRAFMLVFTDIANPEANLGWDGHGSYFSLKKLSDNYFGIQITGNSHDGGPYIMAKKAVHTEKGLNFENSFNAGHIINEEGQNKPLHISISRMGRRVQVFANEEKVLDITAAFQKDVKLTSARFFVFNHTENDNYYVSNIRYAVGQPDTRSKLLDGGKYSTSAITFHSGSAEIKEESYAILKEIADALKSQPAKSVTIIGHTDSDGSVELNQALSQKRATAVMRALQSEFQVGNTMETDGKGASEPVAENNTPTGKAKNRRVEFVVN
jgi:OmpA-OmpF porin, OOP family